MLEGRGDWLKGVKETFCGDENVLIATTAVGYTGLYILIKTPSMGIFIINVLNYALIKLIKKKRAGHKLKIKC